MHLPELIFLLLQSAEPSASAVCTFNSSSSYGGCIPPAPHFQDPPITTIFTTMRMQTRLTFSTTRCYLTQWIPQSTVRTCLRTNQPCTDKNRPEG